MSAEADLSKRAICPLVPSEKTFIAANVKWPLEKMTLRLLWLLLLVCPFWWVIDLRESKQQRQEQEAVAKGKPLKEGEPEWDGWRAFWVMGWLVLLIAMWLVNPAQDLWRWVFAALATLRLFEILVTGLGTILRQKQQVRARNLVTIVLYAMQVTLIFAILDHGLATDGFVSESGDVATRASDFLYVSWTNMLTLDSTYSPQGGAARFLMVSTTTASIFLFSVLLAFGIDAASRGAGSQD